MQFMPYSLNESLGHLASQASRAILRKINQDLVRHGYVITSEQFSVLVHVWDQNGQPQYVLADVLNKDKTTLARLLAGLESCGYIVRMPGQKDGREKNVYLTEQGKSIMVKVTGLVQALLEVGEKGISEEELSVCKSVLRRFSKNLA